MVGTIPALNRYGSMELVLDGTAEAPKAEHIAAIQAFIPNALETIGRLHGRLFFSFLWDPVRIAVNDQNRVGVQFQRRLFPRRETLFGDADRSGGPSQRIGFKMFP